MKLNRRETCSKCGFIPTLSKAWELTFKEECYGVKKCGWTDTDVKEHLHQTCPDCGYMFAVETTDYDALKNKEKWDTTTEVSKAVTVTPTKTTMGSVRSEVQPIINRVAGTRASTDGATVVTPIKKVVNTCHGCPVDDK